MATIEETQAELKGQFDQFSHRQQRVESEVDNTRSELTQAISDLRHSIDRLRQDFGNAQKWQWSCFVAVIIAACAVLVTLFLRRNNMGIFDSGRPSFQEPPKSMGLYRIVDLAGPIKYIGSAWDLSRRFREHSRSGIKMSQGDRFAWQTAKPGVTFEQVRAHEAVKIAQHNPPLNLRAGGGGRLPKAEAGEIIRRENGQRRQIPFEKHSGEVATIEREPTQWRDQLAPVGKQVIVGVMSPVLAHLIVRGIDGIIDWFKSNDTYGNSGDASISKHLDQLEAAIVQLRLDSLEEDIKSVREQMNELKNSLSTHLPKVA